MPIYDWKCKKCGKEETINTQSFDDYRTPPNEEGDDICEKHEWEKQMGTFKLARGSNWKGSKGNWIQLLGLGGWLCQYLDMFL